MASRSLGEIKQRSSRHGKQPPLAIANEHANPLFLGYSRPADTTDQAPDRLCKQEVTGSIPVGSIREVPAIWHVLGWLA